MSGWPIPKAVPVLLLALLAASAPAVAQDAQSTVVLHDLTEDGAYAGCHVTTPNFATYRLTVNEGQHVVLTVQATANNTNDHFLTVEGVPGQTETIGPGGSTVFEFDAPGPGSHAVMCDGETSDLQGLLIVRAAGNGGGGEGENGTPGPGAVLTLAAAVGVALVTSRAAARRR